MGCSASGWPWWLAVGGAVTAPVASQRAGREFSTKACDFKSFPSVKNHHHLEAEYRLNTIIFDVKYRLNTITIQIVLIMYV